MSLIDLKNNNLRCPPTQRCISAAATRWLLKVEMQSDLHFLMEMHSFSIDLHEQLMFHPTK